MKTLFELKQAIGQLPRKDLFALGEWMKELCARQLILVVYPLPPVAKKS